MMLDPSPKPKRKPLTTIPRAGKFKLSGPNHPKLQSLTSPSPAPRPQRRPIAPSVQGKTKAASGQAVFAMPTNPQPPPRRPVRLPGCPTNLAYIRSQLPSSKQETQSSPLARQNYDFDASAGEDTEDEINVTSSAILKQKLGIKSTPAKLEDEDADGEVDDDNTEEEEKEEMVEDEDDEDTSSSEEPDDSDDDDFRP